MARGRVLYTNGRNGSGYRSMEGSPIATNGRRVPGADACSVQEFGWGLWRSFLSDVILSVKWEERSGAEKKDEVGGVEMLKRCE